MTSLPKTSEIYRYALEAITANFTSIAIIDVPTLKYEVIKLHESAQKLIESNSNADDLHKQFTQKGVIEEDRHILANTGTINDIAKHIAKTGSITVEFRSSVSNRSWCRATWTALEVKNGTTTKILYTVEDIQDKKNTDERMLKQTQYINGLISGYDTLIIFNIDKDQCTYIHMSDKMPQDMVRRINTAHGKSFYDLFMATMHLQCHPDHLEMMLCYQDPEYIRQILKNKKRHTKRFLFQKVTGEYIWTEFMLIKFAGENEDPSDVAVCFTNVDADERERRAQQAALEDVRAIVKATDMGMWHIKLVQGQKPQMAVDGKMLELMGLKKDQDRNEEEMYEAWHERIHPDALESVNTSVMKMITGNGVRDENTYLWIHPVKGERWVRCGGIAVPILGGHLLSGYHYDVTDHVLEDMRQKQITEEALAANEAKTVFLHNMIHEIRSPLNAIMGFSQLLSLPDGSWTPQEKDEHYQHIQDGYNILSMLIDDVLDIADASHGNYIVKIDTMKVNDVCRNAIRTAEFRKPKAVKMYFTSEVNDDYTIESDARRIIQVLVNYLNNSCKHTWAGEIHLHVSTKENPGRLTFSVADTGEGIPPEMAETIFKRYSKLNAKVQGSGLGLNICSVVAENLGGEVHLDTSYTNGARFVFIL